MQLAFIYAKYLKKTDEAIEYANRAVALDPLTAAVVPLDEARKMTDELFAASGPWLPVSLP